MLTQKTCRDHPYPVVHKPGLVELPHACIDERVAGVSVAPTFKRYFVILPCNGFVAGFETVADHVWEVKQNLHKKLPPDKLRKPGFVMLQCKGHTPTYGDGAEPQGGS